MLRRTKAQVLVDLPPKRHALVPLVDEAVVRGERETVERLAANATARANKAPADERTRVSREPAETEAEVRKLKVDELRTQLKALGLSTQGLPHKGGRRRFGGHICTGLRSPAWVGPVVVNHGWS